MKAALARMAASIGHLYPLKSGCGRIANSAPFRWIDPPGGPDAIAHVTGGRAAVPAGDHVGRAMRFLGDLDPKVSWVVDRVVQPGDTALDIGGNLGLVSLRMAARTGAQGAVHVFEPQPRMQGYLHHTLALNPKAPITLHGIALGDTEDELAMTVSQHNAGTASLVQREQAGRDTIRVPVRPLDSYAAGAGLTHADVIKIDVEGFEARVLAGAQTFLKAAPPRAILLEENDPYPAGKPAEALRLLQDLGYDIFGLPRQLFRVRLQPLAARPACHDFVALHRTCPAGVRHALGL